MDDIDKLVDEQMLTSNNCFYSRPMFEVLQPAFDWDAGARWNPQAGWIEP